jgi:REP element-mobilizing transposase RayT
MARHLRIQFCGALYHVISRGNEKRDIFRDNRDRSHYLEILSRYKDELEFNLYCYVLMPNHTHLLIETPLGNIAKIMLCVNTSYVTYFNKRHNRVGHLFQGRYKSIIVDKENYLLQLIRYIHLNPLRAGIVERLEDYRWSSHRQYLIGLDKTGLIRVDSVLPHFGKSLTQSIREYKDFMSSRPGDHDVDIKDGIFIGEDEFVEDMVKKMKLNRSETPSKRREKGGVSLSRIVTTLSREGHLPTAEIRFSKRRNVKEVRDMAIWLARKLSGKTLRELGEYFGGIRYQTVSKAVQRVQSDQRLRQISQRHSEKLTKIEG